MALLFRFLPLLIGSALLTFAQPAISPAGGGLPDGRVGTPYTFAFSGSGGTAPYVFTVASGTLPTGYTLSPAGVFGGTATAGYAGSFSVQVRDANALVAFQTYSLRVREPVTIVTVGFPSIPYGITFSQCLTAQGGTIVDGASNGIWSIVGGSLPPGVQLVNQSPACGVVGNRSAALTGAPTQEGIYDFTLRVADTQGQFAQRTFSIVVLSAGPLVVTPLQLAFTCQVGGVCSVGAQGVNINSGGGQLSGLSISVVGGNWLRTSGLNTNTTPASISVFVDPAFVTTAGTYQGSITIRATATAPITIPVTLTAVGQVQLGVTAGSLNFTLTGVGQPPPAQSFTVTSSGPSEVPVAVNVTAGFPYVQITQSSETTPSVITVRINITGLPLGVTTGNIQITANASNSPINVPVTISANAPSALTVFPAQLAFNYATGNTTPFAQAINVSSVSPGLEFTTSTSANTPWLVIANTVQQTPGQVLVAVNPTGLTPAVRTGTVILTPIAGGNPVVIPVTFNVTTAVANLVLNPPQITFNFQIGGGAPQEQTIAINSSSLDTTLAYTASVNTVNTTWLRLSNLAGTTPGFIGVSLNTLGLTEGVYNAAIQVQANGAGNNPQSVPITLNVSRQFGFASNPTALNFTGAIASAPQSQAIQLTAFGGNLGFTAASSSSWLTVSTTSSTAPATLGVSVNPQGLGPGTYQGSVNITATTSAAGTFSIPVTFTITSNSQLRVTPGSLQFTSTQGAAPLPQTLQVTSSTTPIPFTVQTTATWIGLSNSGGTTPGSPQVNALPQGLAPGTYTSEIRVVTTEPGNNAVVIPVTYVVTAVERTPIVRAVTNAASLQTSSLSPLMIFTIFGENLGPANLVVGGLDGSGRLPRSIAGVRLLVDGVAAPLLYVSSGQLSGIAPSGIGNRPNLRIQAEVDGTLGASVEGGVLQSAPAIFTADSSGRGQAAAFNEEGGLNGSITPASPGSIVVLYLTGAGEVNPIGEAGAVAGNNVSVTANELRIEIDGQAAEVLYAGQAPGQVFGLTQVNVRVPTGSRRGAVSVVARSGIVASAAGVTIEVQ